MVDDSKQPPQTPREFVGIHMKCCNVYTRVYINAARDAFVGWCPRCGARVRIPVVQDGGSTDRFFSAH